MHDGDDLWDDSFGAGDENREEPPFDESQVDEDELDRLERDFFEDSSKKRSPFGQLVELDEFPDHL